MSSFPHRAPALVRRGCPSPSGHALHSCSPAVQGMLRRLIWHSSAEFASRQVGQLRPRGIPSASGFEGLRKDYSTFSWLRNAFGVLQQAPGRPNESADSLGMGEITEGKAKVLLADKNDVFYNKAQVVNRDLSIAVIKTFIKKRNEELKNKEKHMRLRVGWAKQYAKKAGKKPVPKGEANGDPQAPGLHILEAMAASGLRAMRYALEIPGVEKVHANDIDAKAVEAMRKNIAHNGIEDKVEPTKADARILMLQKPDYYDVIDLDPYGAPVMLLDSAVQSICDGGLLCVTATDMAVLCGNSSEACFMKYGAYPVKGKHCHESALRILLHNIQSHACRYKKYIVPVLSVHVDYYVRVFVRVFTSANISKDAATKVSYIYQCMGCHSFSFQPVGKKDCSVGKKKAGTSIKYSAGIGPAVGKECDHCGKRFRLGGPLWTEPIHDKAWIKDVLGTVKKGGKEEFAIFNKVRGLLTVIDEELLDAPLSICMHDVTRTLKCTPPPAADVRSAIANAGYWVSSTHDNPIGIKTNVPMEVFWDIMRCWVQDHPSSSNLEEGSPGANILAKPPKVKAKFARVFSALSKGKMKGTPRFTPNPEAYWGPGTRAGSGGAKRKRFLSAPSERIEKPENKEAETDAKAEAKTEATS